MFPNCSREKYLRQLSASSLPHPIPPLPSEDSGEIILFPPLGQYIREYLPFGGGEVEVWGKRLCRQMPRIVSSYSNLGGQKYKRVLLLIINVLWLLTTGYAPPPLSTLEQKFEICSKRP
jgi:hypothetical protein